MAAAGMLAHRKTRADEARVQRDGDKTFGRVPALVLTSPARSERDARICFTGAACAHACVAIAPGG